MKIVLFGDSLFGQFGKNRILKLEAMIPGSDVYNCAAGGWDSNDCVKKAPYIARLKPDIMILSLGTNDASSWKLVDIETFKINVPQIINAFTDSRIIYMLPPPSDESKQPHDRLRKNETLKQYYDVAKNICGQKEFRLLIRGIFSNQCLIAMKSITLRTELIWRRMPTILSFLKLPN